MKDNKEVRDENSWLDESALDEGTPAGKGAKDKAGKKGDDGHVRKSRDVKKPKRRVETESDYNRMRRVLMFVAATAVVVGVGSILFSSWQLLQAKSLQAANEADLKTVLVASRAISAGDSILASDLVEAQVPSSYVPAGAVEPGHASELVGKSAVVSLSKGLPVSAGSVRGSSQPSSLATAIESDTRVAYGVAVDDTSGMSPLIHVGDRVNVIAETENGDIRTIVSNVRVLALNGQLSGSSENGYDRVVLEVSQDQATTIAGSSNASLSLLAAEEAE